MRSVRENLIAAKALIDTPEKWGKGVETFPLFADGQSNCLCAHGALLQAMKGDWGPAASAPVEALQDALPAGYFGTTPDFNDDPSTTHADIMALFDRAIAAQDEQP